MHLNIEHKLDLIQQLHREQEENERSIYRNLKSRNYDHERNDLDAYGYSRSYGRNRRTEESSYNNWPASFQLRLLMAVLCFLCLFVIEKKEIEFYGIGYTEITEYLDSNMTVEQFLAYF